MKKTWIALALAAGLGSVPAGVRAQLPADARWHTVESTHFRVTYEDGLEPLARRAAASAERAYAALALLVADAPRGTIDIVVADNVDFSNGYATPFPSNRIVIYAKPPVDVLALQHMEDWIDLVIVHELAHIFHLDVTGGIGRALRAVFGRVPASWPFFPVVFTPTWGIEGLAVGIESVLTDAGRIHGSYHEMVVRTAVLADRMDGIDRLGGATPLWPGGARAYIYGSLFMDYLTRRYGADATARIVRASGDALLPPALWYGNVARRALGVTFRQAYEEWQRELVGRYGQLAAEVTAAGLTVGEPLTRHGVYAMHPRHSPDGNVIAYAGDDWRRSSRVRAIDARSGAELWSRRNNSLNAVAWLPDGGLLTSDLDFVDRFRIYSDLYVHRGPSAGRITDAQRLQDPDVDRSGRRIVAVENRDGTNRLVLIDRASGARRHLVDFVDDVHWALPRFAPDGARIAAGRWRSGGDYQVVVMDTIGRVLFDVTRSPGVNTAPAWSPDGRWLLFWSDRTGIPNIFAAEIGQLGGDQAGATPALPGPGPLPRVRQVTNVLTGAFHPDVAPDGRSIVYSAYRHDGFRLERIPFDPATWRDPMPEHFAELAAMRGTPATTADPHATAANAEFSAAVRGAVAAADTSAGVPRRYSALKSMRPHTWIPMLESGGHRDYFFGFWTLGADLVGRHAWDLGLSLHPGSGQTQGAVSYTYRGLPALRPFGLHPSVSVRADRDWGLWFSDPATDRYIDEREDRVEAGVSLNRQRWRAASGLSFAGEAVRRSRHLYGFDDGARLANPDDDLLGARVGAFYSRFVMPPFAISRENGVMLQLSARQRWDRNPRTVTSPQGSTTFDGGYREWNTRNTGYLALPLPGFARHVIAGRVSGLYRDGPGAGLSGAGGVSGGALGLGVPGLIDDFGGVSRALPVRGFPENQRIGNRGWSASAEYRAPLAILATPLRPLPVFLDRLSAAAFVDAGHAWCDATAASRFTSACAFTDASATPLLGAGAEATVLAAFWGMVIPVRFGAGVPLQGAEGSKARPYISASVGF
jgi:hypothetical protein